AWAGKVGSAFSPAYNTGPWPAAAGLKGGGFVIVYPWTNGLFGQRYNADGSVAGAHFPINSTYLSEGYVILPTVASLVDGGFIASWASCPSGSGVGQDGSGCGVYAQRFNADGSRAGDEFRVNTHTKDDQFHPAAAGLTDGGFVIVWHSKGQGETIFGIYGQRYNSDGTRLGEEFRISASAAGGVNSIPSISALRDGGFAVAWASKDSVSGSY